MKLTPAIHKPALEGGKPVFQGPYGHGCKHDEHGIRALSERIKNGGQLPLALGPSIRTLREQARTLFDVNYAIPCSSGTAAIHAGLAAMGIHSGDEVITTPVTDAGTILGIMSLNAIPVFADVDPENLMIDADSIRSCLSDRTRAILPVHYYGCPADMEGIQNLACAHELPVLEDCAQSWLAEWRGQYVGTLGDVGAFSMNESKHVSVGEGGLIITNRESIADFADRFVDKSYRRFEDGAPGPDMVACNYRMSELCATLALRQFEKVEAATQKRYQLGERLADGVETLPGLRLMRSPDACRCTYWSGLLFVAEEQSGVSTETLSKALEAEGVRCNAFNPRIMPEAELFRNLDRNPHCLPNYTPGDLKKDTFSLHKTPNACSIRGRVVCIRINEFMSPSDIDRIIEAIRKLSNWYQQHPEIRE